jgi:hypothetical protein
VTDRGPIKILEDGTRIYSNYARYTPMPDEQRTNTIRKPADPGALRFHAQWFLPLDLLPDDLRLMPQTRPDTDAYDHMAKPRKCMCVPCQRPEAVAWQEKWRKDHGLIRARPRRRSR